ncbi:FecR domain-containing protein [Pirellulales bacterium]|nr:FecR domain-containing protein [Pirellulales bacterium]
MLGQLERLCDGEQTADDAQSLANVLRHSRFARRLYVRFVSLHFWLAMKYGRYRTQADDFGLEGLQADLDLQAVARRRRTQTQTLLAVAAVVAAAALPLLGYSLRPSANDSPPTPSGRPAAAVVASLHECEWGTAGDVSRLGGVVHVGDRLDLGAGLAELRFDSGATTVVRGPASLQVTSPRSCTLDHGEIFVDVRIPSATFTVTAAGVEVEDVGTAYGVRFKTSDALQVAVVKGKVRLYDGPRRKDSATTYYLGELGEGETGQVTAASWSEPRSLIALATPPDSFVQDMPAEAERWTPRGDDAFVWDGFNHAPPSGRLTDVGAGLGWPGPWNTDEVMLAEANVIAFADAATQRTPGNAAVHRPLPPALAKADQLYASARFRIAGSDRVCTAWVLLFEDSDPRVDDEANLLAFGISDGKFSARLAASSATLTVNPNSKRLGDFGDYVYGQEHRLVARLELGADGERDRLSFWIDPPTGETPPPPDHVVDYHTGRRRADTAAVRFWEMNDDTRGYIDDLRIGRSWRGVVE